MKRGKDDDMSTEPMFPRLHVNDAADKGGPRAPPRNKMALYEQLSIPSQRFGSSLNRRIQTGLASPASSSQVSGAEKNTSNPLRLNPLTPTPFSDVQTEERKKIKDTNEFTVPVFVKSTVRKINHCTDRDSVSSICSSRSGLPENTTVRKEREENVILAADQPPIPNEVVDDGNTREAEVSVDRDRRVRDRSDVPDRDFGNDLVESTGDEPRSESRRADGKRSRNSGGGSCISLRLEKVDKCDDDFLEKSMLESIYGSDIAPDDVVGIIGQKHFWKARTAIVNQQRVFAIQVFELHRLVKVQKLIAGSPEVLIENGTFMQKSRSPSTKLPPKFIAKPLPCLEKPPTHKTECPSENPAAKPPLSSAENPSQSPNRGATNTQPIATESKTEPWRFLQPPPGGPQWLVPVMSPSEGLVYKPYPGPGIPGPVYPGNGPPFSPVPGFGFQPPHHQETQMVFPGTSSPSGHTFFPPPFSMAFTGSAGESVNHFTGPIPQIVGGGVGGLKAERHSSSCNAPNTWKTVSVSRPSKFKASKGSDLQMGSTASSPGERRDPLPLFPVAPVVSERDSRSHVSDQPSRVIKVVPHSRRSATESAARIFRFIQEERKQL